MTMVILTLLLLTGLPGQAAAADFDQTDNFDTDWGNWTNTDGTEPWARNSGSTQSSNTGPSSGQSGSWYVYTETSNGVGSSDTFHMESNNLDADAYNLNVSFYTHMYGSDIGTLYLDVWTGSSWDPTGWSRTANTNSWVSHNVDLSSYTGTIKLRFRYTGATGYRGDAAVDTIRVYGDAAGGPDSLVVTSNAPLANSAIEGNTDVQMQRLQVDCTAGGADDGICEITGITVDDLGAVTGTEIDNLKIYIDTDTSFAGTEPNVADATFAGVSKAIDLTSIALGSRQVSAGTPKYIWVTYDLAFGSAPTAVQTSVTTVAVNTGSGDTGATGAWNSNNFAITAPDGMNCASCHAYPPADGTRGVNGAVVGDHQTPAHLAATCNVCHVVPATETSADAGHRNGYIQMKDGTIGDAASGDNGSYSKGATFAQSNNPTTGTCSNVDCHMNVVTPQWGVGTLDHTVALGAGDLSNGTSCSVCHDDNSGRLASWTDIYVEHLSNCATCHNSTRQEVIDAIALGADPTNCLNCHSGNTTSHGSVDHVAKGYVTLTSPCNDCHDPGSAENATVDVTHSGNCSLCHTTVPDLQQGVPVNGGTCATCHTGDVQTAHASCTTCHGEPPSGTAAPNREGAHSEHDALGFGTVTPNCAACHDGAIHYINGSTDVSILSSFDAKSGTASSNGSTCSNTRCHGGRTTPNWATGTLDLETANAQCTSCHASGTAEYNSYNSGDHTLHMTEYNADCIDCHSRSKLAVGSGGNTHFSNLQTTTFEQDPATTIGGGDTRVNGTWGGEWRKSNCSTNCH